MADVENKPYPKDLSSFPGLGEAFGYRHNPTALQNIEVWIRQYSTERLDALAKLLTIGPPDQDEQERNMKDFKKTSERLHREVSSAAKNANFELEGDGNSLEQANELLANPWRKLVTYVRHHESLSPILDLICKSHNLLNDETSDKAFLHFPIHEPIKEFPYPSQLGYELIKGLSDYFRSESSYLQAEKSLAMAKDILELFI